MKKGRMKGFHDYPIESTILKALDEMGFVTPSEIQAQALPILLENKGDFIGQAQTGTGKTAAFGIPLIQQLNPEDSRVQAIVLAPTRELAVQISEEMTRLAKFKKIRILPVYGGQDIGTQLRALNKGIHIVVGTPGRVMDHLHRGSLNLQSIRYFVLDEADEMLDRGFREEIETILSHAGADRHIWLFSATLSREIRAIASRYMTQPEEIRIQHSTVTTKNTEEHYYVVREEHKLEALSRLIDLDSDMYAIVFCQTKMQTADIAEKLILRGFKAEALHGDMNQTQRDRVMKKFKSKGVRLLVATDVAARGIDVQNLTHVINYSLPPESASYIHRIGRTGRAGKTGIAITLVTPQESHKLRRLESNTRKRMTASKVPSLPDIMKAHMERLIAEFQQAAIDPGEMQAYVDLWKPTLSAYTGEQIAHTFITLLGREILEKYEDDKELNAQESSSRSGRGSFRPDQGMVSLILDAGSRHGIQTGTIVGKVCNLCGLDNRDLGRIFIHDVHTEFKVDSEFAERVIRKMNGITLNGKKISVTYADEKLRNVRGMMKKKFHHQRSYR